uniref:Uncharacterized protein n=1 Tax=Aegilops tauschii subsp. strangulata TaxID=200361 RepID=A0A453B9P8_AEGTS
LSRKIVSLTTSTRGGNDDLLNYGLSGLSLHRQRLKWTDKGPLRVCVARSIGFPWSLVVRVSIKESNCLAIGVVTSTSSSMLLCNMVHLLQLSGPVVMDCKSVLHGLMLQPTFL